MPAFGLVGIRMVSKGIRLHTWTRVIVNGVMCRRYSGYHLLHDDDTCLYNYHLRVTESCNRYGDIIQEQITSTHVSHAMMHCCHNSEENIGAYAKWLWLHWRNSGGDEVLHMIMLYDMIWAGLKPYLHPKLRPFPMANATFDSSDVLCSTIVDIKTPPQSNDNQQWRPERGRGNQNGMKRLHQTESWTRKGESTTTGAGLGPKPGSESKLPPESLVNTDNSQRRFEVGVSLRCGMNCHQFRECPKHWPTEKLKQKSTQKQDTNVWECHVNCQRSFDTQQQTI